MDLTQVISVIRFFREKESHGSEKWFPLSFFLIKVSIFKLPITNRLSSYFSASWFREFESSLKNIYLLLLIGGL